MSNASVIRPGLLVSLKSTVKGGVTYQREELDAEVTATKEQDVASWKTTRVIEDKDEHEAATKVRSKALALIRKCCQTTTFGLLCPQDAEGALDVAVKAARQLVDNHNAQATHTQVAIFVLKGRVASDDAEAAKAITSEIAMLVQKMDASIEKFDPKAIREAADRARELSNMLDDSKKTKIDAAIAQARKAAREITKRIVNEGEDKVIVLKDIQRGQIESARIAFLDMSGETTTSEPLPAVSAQRFADLDVESETPADVARRVQDTEDEMNATDMLAKKQTAPTRAIEMEV